MPIYKNVYFRIDCGYLKEKGYDHTEESLQEIQSQLEAAGWTLKVRRSPGVCPQAALGKSSLYCHPQEISGNIEKSLIEPLENILKAGKNYRYLKTDIYETVYDLDADELREYHLSKNKETIEHLLLKAFRIPRSNLFKSVEAVLDCVSRAIHINTLNECSLPFPRTVEREVVNSIFAGLRDEGHFCIKYGKGGSPIARTDPRPENIPQQGLFA